MIVLNIRLILLDHITLYCCWHSAPCNKASIYHVYKLLLSIESLYGHIRLNTRFSLENVTEYEILNNIDNIIIHLLSLLPSFIIYRWYNNHNSYRHRWVYLRVWKWCILEAFVKWIDKYLHITELIFTIIHNNIRFICFWSTCH